MADTVALFEAHMATRDYEAALDVLESDTVVIWFGMQPNDLVEHLRVLLRQLDEPGQVLGGLARIVTSSSLVDISTGAVTRGLAGGDRRLELLFLVARLGWLRSRGHSRAAMELAIDALAMMGTMQPLVDMTAGWSLHVTVQAGAAAMMAGEFRRALTLFTQAQLQTAPEKFRFLIRGVLVRSALIHATFGDIEAAGSLLARAGKVGRTSSWVEEQLDAQIQVVEVLVEPDPQAGWRRLQRIDLSQLGEQWAFYVLAMERMMREDGHLEDLEARLEDLDSMPLPRLEGQGLNGSVFPWLRAQLAMDAGQHGQARQQMARADARMTYTRIMSAAAKVSAGRSAQALKDVQHLREDVRALRQMELRRLSVMASAHWQMGDRAACLATVRHAMELSRPLTRQESRQFSPLVRRIAAEELEGWDDDLTAPSLFLNAVVDPQLRLSPRELEILELLGEGLGRAEIAQRNFVSLNTLKSQLRSIYRKLAVTSSGAAVREAHRRGII